MRTPPGVDVDLHLLHEPQLDGQPMRGCIARAHESLAVSNLAPGEYYVVVDTWTNGDGRHLSGLYDLAFEVVEEDEWRVVELKTMFFGADGVAQSTVFDKHSIKFAFILVLYIALC